VIDKLFYASATTLALRIRERELSSEEVVQAHLQRLGAHIEEALPPRIKEASAITRHYWQRPESASGKNGCRMEKPSSAA
jgi:hypothetical protein